MIRNVAKDNLDDMVGRGMRGRVGVVRVQERAALWESTAVRRERSGLETHTYETSKYPESTSKK